MGSFFPLHVFTVSLSFVSCANAALACSASRSLKAEATPASASHSHPQQVITMAGSSGEIIIVPRNFQLLEELEKAEKGQTDMSISMGLSDGSDVYMREWVCTILGPNGSPLENRIISVHLTCADEYPKVPPTCRFLTKINADFVVRAARSCAARSCAVPSRLPAFRPAPPPPPLLCSCSSSRIPSSASHVHCCLVLWQAGDGVVSVDKLKKILDLQGGWSAEKRTMQTVLLALRAQLRSKTLPKQQPAEGATYT